MSVAAPTSTEPKASTEPVSLWTTGLVGGAYVLGALAVVFYGVPRLYDISLGSFLVSTLSGWGVEPKLINWSVRVALQLAAVVLLAIFGIALAGPNPPKGIRGSIVLGISTIFTGFFLVRGLLMIVERMATKFDLGQVLSFLFVAACLYLFYKFLKSDRFPRWSVALEGAGWIDTHTYKNNQGTRVRRLTILGVLLLLGSGVYTLVHNNVITMKDWVIALPFTNATVTLLPDATFTIPLILAGLTMWFAWRVVNYPPFADFLIATEAEINKVSWTPRPRLIQDTVVVLTTVVIITLFLFVVDIFWGKLLSREIIGVLPSDAETQSNTAQQINTNEY